MGIMPEMCRPELLAPAGDWDCAKAAVENGADAIYFGLDRFNARMRADNFTEADLPRLMAFLHRRGVRGYVTFNTLVFANEMAEAELYLRHLIAAGVDAVLVQDAGVCRLIRRLSPDFPIHASTQMTVSSAAGVAFARELGCSRVVMARECSVKDLAAVKEASAESSGVSLECFVHGALCVAYSGQCLTSEALGGRSANRGECAQACRMPYELVADGQVVAMGDRRYLLSPQDLSALELLPELMKAGVEALKIEGRLKSPEYVANITRVYRKAIDLLAEGRGEEFKRHCHDSRYDLEMGFSRGLFTGWLRGVDNQTLVHARFGKKRGVYLGEVSRVDREQVYIALQGPLKLGDGVVFDSGHPEREEEGGRVYSLRPPMRSGRETGVGFGRGDVHFDRVHRGDKVWKTSDPELDRHLRQTFASEVPAWLRPLQLEVRGRVGEPLVLVAHDGQGHDVSVISSMPLEAARKQPLTSQRLEEQLGRLGGTPFRLGRLVNRIEGNVILPMSELNRLRRDVVGRLDAARSEPVKWSLRTPEDSRPARTERLMRPRLDTPQLIPLVRGMEQLDAVLDGGFGTVYCDFEDPRKYREAVARTRARASDAGQTSIFVAPPRIFKPGEEWILQQVRSCGADGYLVRNPDHIRCFSGERLVGDFSLNVANALTAEFFLERYSLDHVTASYDLNVEQLEALLLSAPPEWFEVVIHQHMPMFHMEHCVFCAFLSQGRDYRDCGRPCDKHRVSLRDRVGAEHAVKADAGCRNTVFNGRAQTGAEFVSRLLTLGVRRFRVEFVNETGAETRMILGRYQSLLNGEISGAELWKELRLVNQLGVTRGPMGVNKVLPQA
jgi:putative protease